eukprot:gnl/TRDRNA2_/TRDRNA2_136034_c0_seq1.p1 gnl/TRDRNA2_/TRDRNA2_136034_c0~~gnl/TRDRNA2_/TRDRNA2_136034_c0_seq1.p1  ORF type:complete len:460 (-),score=76.14 gnl/TRDRNA2_/TRDRNA2_136034_c0_seq1:85-1281(-)
MPSRQEVEKRKHCSGAWIMGRHGLEKISTNEILKERIKELQEEMSHSMAKSFPVEVWNACQLRHPEDDRPLGEVDPTVNPFHAPTEERVVTKEEPKLTREAWRKSCFINYQHEKVENAARLSKQNQFVALSRHTGWQVVDVQELHDIFEEHATDGRVNIITGQLAHLVDDIWPEATMEDVQKVVKHIAAYKRRQRATQDAEEESPHEIAFAPFFYGLNYWFRRDLSEELLRERCTLTRYATEVSEQEAISARVLATSEAVALRPAAVDLRQIAARNHSHQSNPSIKFSSNIEMEGWNDDSDLDHELEDCDKKLEQLEERHKARESKWRMTCCMAHSVMNLMVKDGRASRKKSEIAYHLQRKSTNVRHKGSQHGRQDDAGRSPGSVFAGDTQQRKTVKA